MTNEQEKIAENEDLVPKSKATSVIWNYFSYKKDDIDQTHVLCRQCLTSVDTEVTQVICLTLTLVPHSSVRQKEEKSVQVNCPQDGSSAA